MADHVFIIAIIAVVIGLLNSFLLFLLWRSLKRETQRLWQYHSATQRQGKEIAQLRYAIASILPMIKGGKNTVNDLISKVGDIAQEKAHKNGTEEVLITDDDLQQVLDKEAPVTDTVHYIEFDTMKDSEILEFVKKCVRTNNIALAMQPIVVFPERKTVYYEVFARINTVKQGYLPAQKFITVAKNNNLVGALDSLLMMRCLQLLKNRTDEDEQSEFFINVSIQTLINKEYLFRLVEFLSANTKLSSRLVFEMTQEDWMKISAAVKSVLEGLALLGCRFSMDKVEMLGMDIERLTRQNINFIKLDANILAKEIANSGDIGRIKKIKSMLDEQRINIIIEKVENEKQLSMLHELHAGFGQGFLFGAPVIMD